MTLWASLASGAIGEFVIETGQEIDRDGVDRLWLAVRAELAASPVRGASHLADRYARDDRYLFVHVRSDRAELLGLGVVKRPREVTDARLHGIRVATLSDVLYPPSSPRVGLALLRAAEGVARSVGADSLLNGTTAGAVRRLTRRRGFFRLPGNLHVLARFPTEGSREPATLDQWWITRGDSEGDGSF
jgi:hypothetical protein